MKNKCLYRIVFVTFLALTQTSPVFTYTDNKSIDVIFFNLSEGEATLVVTENQKRILINTGSTNSKDELINHLKKLNVTSIDYLLITSTNDEYDGNMDQIAQKYDISEIIVPNHEDYTEEKNDKRFFVWKDLTDVTLTNKLSLKLIDETEEGEVTFLLLFGNESILFSNDETSDVEERITKITNHVDVIKIAAFGSGDSPSQSFLELTDPYLSVIFHSNEYEINEDLVERLAASWIDVYFVRQTGSVYLRMTTNDFELLS
jgi:competence protein ComEC